MNQSPGPVVEQVSDFLKRFQGLKRPLPLQVFMVESGPARPGVHSHGGQVTPGFRRLAGQLQ